MKTNKITNLIKFGFSKKTLMSLNESDINKLHKNLIEGKKETKEEVKQTITKSTYDPSNQEDQRKLAAKGIMVDPTSKKISLNQGKEKKKGEKVIEDGEMTEAKKKKSKKLNPWAICTSQLGNQFKTTERSEWSPKQMDKYERCVKAIKQSMNEGKDPVALIIENKILSLVEKHIKPKMKKGDLLNVITKKSINKPIGTIGSIDMSEDTKEAPVKTPVKTPTKPDKDSPYKPKVKPAPKAKHETKEQATAPAKPEPTTKPGIKTPPKPDKDSPYKPKTSPNPKARKSMPSWMSFDSIGIKLKK